jgi:hypothetical protein
MTIVEDVLVADCPWYGGGCDFWKIQGTPAVLFLFSFLALYALCALVMVA